MFGLLFMLVSLVGCLFAPLVRCLRSIEVRRVAFLAVVPLVLTLTVCAIADASGGFNPRASRRAASRQAGRNFANGVHVDVGRGVVIGRDFDFHDVRSRGGVIRTRTFRDRHGRLITVDEFGRVIDIR